MTHADLDADGPPKGGTMGPEERMYRKKYEQDRDDTPIWVIALLSMFGVLAFAGLLFGLLR